MLLIVASTPSVVGAAHACVECPPPVAVLLHRRGERHHLGPHIEPFVFGEDFVEFHAPTSLVAASICSAVTILSLLAAAAMSP